MKSPEEQAKEIIEKFRSQFDYMIEYGDANYPAKQCAIIHVEGIIEAINDAMLYKQSKRDHWQQVLTILKQTI